MTLDGKTALVTGAARRVGREIAFQLAKAGAAVVIHYNESADEAESAAEEIRAAGGHAWIIQASLERREDITQLLDTLRTSAPPIDILVNNASIFQETPIVHLPMEDWDRHLDINLRAPFELARVLGLAMAERGWGRIINIADTAIAKPYRGYAPYLISKAGLEMATRVLALELAPAVLVNTISPGVVLPPETDTAGSEARVRRTTLLQRPGTPADVARLAVFLARDNDYATGGNFTVDGGAGVR